MGKIPSSLRSAIATSLVPKPASNPTPLPAVRSQKTLFDSPSLSDAEALFDSLLASPKSPGIERDFYNSVLQSCSSLSTLQDSFSFLNHMVKASPSFAPDHSTFHILLKKACRLSDSGDCEVFLAEVHKVINFMVNSNVIPGKATADVAVTSLVSVDRLDCAVELIWVN
ncbi:hypothetical protein MLD38_031085 [Melastoma candidum]|uniref:Uncharacterized protein n=1 Tax=Melastoma candidum TaxID=119954 RepID=A0ACB9MS47_9MYRT|nr:hypothetical protein MLD38_031085 [Melastoma candidum]